MTSYILWLAIMFAIGWNARKLSDNLSKGINTKHRGLDVTEMFEYDNTTHK